MQLKPISELNKRPEEIDSHAGRTEKSRLSLNFRESVTMPGALTVAASALVYYPRVKRLRDGSYLLFTQDRRVSSCVYYAKSPDGLHYGARNVFYRSRPVVREDGEEDTLCYATTDALVLSNGDVLAFTSFRYNKGYALDAKYCGILMRRSSDNGNTWSKERLIYLGRNWEPSAIERPDGEIQVYFSHTAPKFYLDPTVRTASKIHTSSGSAIIRSRDGGEHWEPDVMGAPYAAWRVSQNYVETMENGTKIFTNQMPVALSLHNGDIALATESDMMVGRFMLTMSYSSDNWARPLGIDEDGPADKTPAFTYGAGPYLAQFPSGETVLFFNTQDKFFVRMGDERARGFSEKNEILAFSGRTGYWGTVLVDTPHSLLACAPHVREERDETGRIVSVNNDLMVGRYYLNHTIRAERAAGELFSSDGDALFLGAGSQAQTSVRVALDEENLYIRSDRLDRRLEHRDGEKICLAGEDGLFITADYSLEGDLYATVNGRGTREITHETTLFGELDGDPFYTNGAVTVVTVPRKFIGERSRLGISVKLSDYEGDQVHTEYLPGVEESDTSTYMEILL